MMESDKLKVKSSHNQRAVAIHPELSVTSFIKSLARWNLYDINLFIYDGYNHSQIKGLKIEMAQTMEFTVRSL